MPTIRFQPNLDYPRKSLASDLITAVLGAVAPGAAMKRYFDPQSFSRPTHILAFGKASIEMTNAAIECLGTNFARATVISTPTLCAQAQFKNKFVDLLAADHPLPSHLSISATNELIEHARTIPHDHQALVLISGGASAMLCSPKEGITLERIIETTDALLRSGAPIQELNAARSKLETLKAGGLAKILEHITRTDAYVLSDVIGGDPTENIRTIASGPVAEPDIPHTIIASNQSALDALCAWVALEHINPIHTQRDAVGFAADEAKGIAKVLIDSIEDTPCAVCLGGEPTVDITNTSTPGSGGPMLELALACALELSTTDFHWTVITLATDGIDGPTNAAGAIITTDMLKDPTTIAQAQHALEHHNALPICDTLGATIRTGPTGTNVNDIALVIRWD